MKAPASISVSIVMSSFITILLVWRDTETMYSRKHINVGLPTVSEGESLIAMVGSMKVNSRHNLQAGDRGREAGGSFYIWKPTPSDINSPARPYLQILINSLPNCFFDWKSLNFPFTFIWIFWKRYKVLHYWYFCHFRQLANHLLRFFWYFSGEDGWIVFLIFSLLLESVSSLFFQVGSWQIFWLS